jgi:hypothetical protein
MTGPLIQPSHRQQYGSYRVLSSIRSERIFWTAYHTVRRRLLSSITRAPCRKVMGVPGQRSQVARNVEGRPLARRAACKEKAPLSAGLLSHTHYLHGA